MTRLIDAVGEMLRATKDTLAEWLRVFNLKRRRDVAVKPGATQAVPIEPETVELLTLRHVISWIAENRPADTRVAKCAVLCERDRRNCRVVSVFLDAGDELVCGEDGVPYGRAQIARRLDDELQQFFGGQPMVIFE